MEYVRQTGWHQYASTSGGRSTTKNEDDNKNIREKGFITFVKTKAGMWKSVFSVNTLM